MLYIISMRTPEKFVVLAVAVSVLACQNPFLRPDPQTEIQLEVELDSMPNVYEPGARVLAYQTAYVEVTVYEDSSTPFFSKTFGVTEENGRFFARGSLPGLPAGDKYWLEATTYDGSGTAWTSGSASFSVGAGSTQKVTLQLNQFTSPTTGLPFETLNLVKITGRRTKFYAFTVPAGQGGYYTVDILTDADWPQSWESPDVSVLKDLKPFKEYRAFWNGQRVFGGMAQAGEVINISIGNRHTFERDFYLYIRKDGDSAPDGKVFTLTLTNDSTIFSVNSYTPVQLDFFPVPFIVNRDYFWPEPAYRMSADQVTASPLVIGNLAEYGKNTWAFSLTHDLDASQWFRGYIDSSGNDLRSFYSSARNISDMYDWSIVSTNFPDGTEDQIVLFDISNPTVALGSPNVDLKWTDTPGTYPSLTLAGDDPDGAPGTNLAYVNVGNNHKGWSSPEGILPQPTDVDWFSLGVIPYEGSYRLWSNASDPMRSPVLIEVFLSTNLTTPVDTLSFDQPYDFIRETIFTPTVGQTYYVKVSPLHGAVGKYQFFMQLAPEAEESNYGFPYPLSSNTGWRIHRISNSSSDSLTLANPYPNEMRYLIQTGLPEPGYLRNVPVFPVQVVGLGVSAEPAQDIDGHPAYFIPMGAGSNNAIDVTTPVFPGRRYRLRVSHWEDETDFNAIVAHDTSGTTFDVNPNRTSRGFSIHLNPDPDWFLLNLQPNRTYIVELRHSSDVAVRDDSVRVRARVTDDLGTTNIMPLTGYTVPNSNGLTRLEWTELAALTRKLEVLPQIAGATGGYTLWAQQRPSNLATKDRWSFNGNLSNSGTNQTFTLTSSGVAFVPDQDGAPQGAVRFNPATNGKAVATGGTTFLANGAANDELTLSLRIRVPGPGLGPDQSLGWIFSQEDTANNLHIGLEAKRESNQLTLVIRSGSGESVLVAGTTFDTWHHVTISLPTSPMAAMNASFNGILSTPAAIPTAYIIETNQVFHLGGRESGGTTFQGDIDDFRVFRGIVWDGNDEIWLQSQPH